MQSEFTIIKPAPMTSIRIGGLRVDVQNTVQVDYNGKTRIALVREIHPTYLKVQEFPDMDWRSYSIDKITDICFPARQSYKGEEFDDPTL